MFGYLLELGIKSGNLQFFLNLSTHKNPFFFKKKSILKKKSAFVKHSPKKELFHGPNVSAFFKSKSNLL